MVDIFISYAREDRSRIELLAKYLENLGWSVFWDRTIPAGKTWRQVIGDALKNARSVIVAWSKDSIESDWVQEEADRGRSRKILIPVFIDNVDPPLGFGAIQAGDLTNWNPAQFSPEFEKLITDISIILGPSPKHVREPKETPNMPTSPNLSSSPPKKSEAVTQGESILAGASIGVVDLVKLVDRLKRERTFGLARKILDRYAVKPEVKQHPDLKLRLNFAQKRSLCTYKDPDLSVDHRLDRALGILEEADPLEVSKDQVTLGQAGAVYKRKWELNGSASHLETSLAYYLRGYKEGVAKDFGYTAINAAFVLELLAETAEFGALSAATSSELAKARRQQAKSIREEIVKVLPELPKQPGNEWLNHHWWFFVTLGEACFGLEDYDQAGGWLKKAAALPEVPDWEWETTARQMSTLLRLQKKTWQAKEQPTNLDGERVLKKFLGPFSSSMPPH